MEELRTALTDVSTLLESVNRLEPPPHQRRGVNLITERRVEGHDLASAVEEDAFHLMFLCPPFGESDELLAYAVTASLAVYHEIIDVKMLTTCKRRNRPHAHDAEDSALMIEGPVQPVACLPLVHHAPLELREVKVLPKLPHHIKHRGELVLGDLSDVERIPTHHAATVESAPNTRKREAQRHWPLGDKS